jgi:hypothetical protein
VVIREEGAREEREADAKDERSTTTRSTLAGTPT